MTAAPFSERLRFVQLTQHSDYALRTLVALGASSPDPLTAAEISAAYGISVHHVLKIIQRLSLLGYVETTRGRGGGVRLALPPEQIRLGELLRQTEVEFGVVACLRQGDTPCTIEPACSLKSVFQRATHAFFEVLDQHTLADVLRPKRGIARLLQLGRPA